ncbi:hypothetical protein F8388_023964, partial [Cannabis sativa]
MQIKNRDYALAATAIVVAVFSHHRQCGSSHHRPQNPSPDSHSLISSRSTWIVDGRVVEEDNAICKGLGFRGYADVHHGKIIIVGQDQVLTNGIEVKLQRNVLDVIEALTGNEEDDDLDLDSISWHGSDLILQQEIACGRA